MEQKASKKHLLKPHNKAQIPQNKAYTIQISRAMRARLQTLHHTLYKLDSRRQIDVKNY